MITEGLPKMSATEFFVLDNGPCHDGSEFWLSTDGLTAVGEGPKCLECGSFTGMRPLIPPIRGVLEANKSLFDLTSNIGGDVLLTEKCWRRFEQEGVTGLASPFPIELTEIRGTSRPVPHYLLAAVQAGAIVDRERSGLITSESRVCPVLH